MKYDVAIIGGGHAGVEAAWAVSSFGLTVALISLPDIDLCLTPCNPSIGGVGKGQVVREIDALGGIMGELADKAAIHYRTLNERKGYAVRSTRLQIDKKMYSQLAEKKIKDRVGITLIRSCVHSVNIKGSVFTVTSNNGTLDCKKLIVTGGTYFGGKMHTGPSVSYGGSLGSPVVRSLGEVISADLMLPVRFKTGTPARLDYDSLDFSRLVEQSSDDDTACLHYGHEANMRFNDQISCFLTECNSNTLKIIRENKDRSPLFNGQIEGVGPRYCPSIEDKAFRYPDKDKHHVFLEREGLMDNSVYPNGLSTSLPTDIQEKYLRTINGLEKCTIVDYGYAVEYDVIDATKLDLTLQCRDIVGLYFAGQINGTSGYEEAAAQGLIAGINSSLALLGKESLILDRSQSYIGVLVEDLISTPRDEPYRLFTARSENRLFIREDNTVLRIFPYRQSLGLDEKVDKFQQNFVKQFNLLSELCDEVHYLPNKSNRQHFISQSYGELLESITLADLLRRSHLDPVITLKKELQFFGVLFEDSVINCCAITKKYAGYIHRQDLELQKYNKLLRKRVQWEELACSSNISIECRQRIKRCRPETFSQLQRIEGIRPATLAYVASII